MKCICFIEMVPYMIKFGGVMQQCVYETNICDIYDVQNALRKLGLIFEKNVIEVAINQWRDRVCLLVADTLNTCCEIVVHLHYVAHHNVL